MEEDGGTETEIPVAKAEFRVGQHVRISREKMKFAREPSKISARRYFGSRRRQRGVRDPSTNWKI